jgi:hypothetical protein
VGAESFHLNFLASIAWKALARFIHGFSFNDFYSQFITSEGVT